MKSAQHQFVTQLILVSPLEALPMPMDRKWSLRTARATVVAAGPRHGTGWAPTAIVAVGAVVLAWRIQYVLAGLESCQGVHVLQPPLGGDRTAVESGAAAVVVVDWRGV
jgi:hypothetical protein